MKAMLLMNCDYCMIEAKEGGVFAEDAGFR